MSSFMYWWDVTTSLTADRKKNIFIKWRIIGATISSINGIIGSSVCSCFRNGAKILAISIKNWNLSLILLSLWCFAKISSDLLLSGHWDDGNAWKCSTTATTNDQIPRALVATGTSFTHLVWQNIKRKLIWSVYGNICISSDWRVME